jgi:hypothetical protein
MYPSGVPASVRTQEPGVRTETKWFRPGIVFLFLLAGFTQQAQANATVLLEEPYSYDGALAGTGHTAVYLTRICAASYVTLRRCNPGERGVVISRYRRIAGYDWIAIPLIPYLYAVEDPEDIPLYTDPKLVAFLRDQYRRAYLEEIAPDAPGGEMPKGDWYELIGSAYDRTTYGFEIETSSEQDDALIAWLDSRPNRASFSVVNRNCADFVNDIFDFYYPESVPRSSIADLGVSTPKHVAKSLMRYSKHHRDLKFTHFVIPQVPGSVKRSKPVRGVLEAVFRAKKYVAFLAAVHPLFGGAAVSVDLIGDRINPAKNWLVFSLIGEPIAPPTKTERRIYMENLRSVSANNADSDPPVDGRQWRQVVKELWPEFDAEGRLVLKAPGNDLFALGVTRGNLQSGEGPVELQRELLISRLKQTLAYVRAPRISGSELREDWQLLEKIEGARREILSKKLDQGN